MPTSRTFYEIKSTVGSIRTFEFTYQVAFLHRNWSIEESVIHEHQGEVMPIQPLAAQSNPGRDEFSIHYVEGLQLLIIIRRPSMNDQHSAQPLGNLAAAKAVSQEAELILTSSQWCWMSDRFCP